MVYGHGKLFVALAAMALVVGCETAPPNATDTTAPPPNQPVAREPGPVAAPPMVTPEPPASPAREPEAATDAASTPMSITELQQRLSALGYKPGPVDGVSGPRTAGALRKFQHDHHLPVTGTLDPQTIAALRKP